MKGLSPARQLILASIFVFSYAFTMMAVQPLVPLFATSRGYSHQQIGFVMAVTPLFALASCLPAGVAARRLGVKRTIFLGAAALSLSPLLLLAAATGTGQVGLIGLSQACAGLGVFLWIGSQVHMVNLSSEDQRLRNIGIYTVFTSIGTGTGPAAGGFLVEAGGFQMAFTGALTLALLAGFLAFLVVETPPLGHQAVHERKRTPSWVSLRQETAALLALARLPQVRLGSLYTFLMFFLVAGRVSFYPLILTEEMRFSEGLMGLLVSIAFLFSAGIRPLFPWFHRRLGRRNLIILAPLVATLAITTTPLLRQFSMLAVAALFSGLALGFGEPVSISIMAESVNRDDQGLGMALRTMASRLGYVVNPLVMGTVAEAINLSAAFYAGGLFMLAGITVLFKSSVGKLATGEGSKGLSAKRRTAEANPPQR